MVDLNEIILKELANDISALYQDERKKLPYGANVIDELHAGENAHSRILRMLLQYEGGGKYPIYSSFLKLISKQCDDRPVFSILSPQFTNEEGRVDVLIKENYVANPFAIIVENKVCEAGDQNRQIERYIDFVKRDIPENSIYVIYLTSDGGKKVSDNSLTDKAKAELGFNERSNGRFITIDYKNHILPWLKEDVLPNMTVKEDLLISSLKLYIDYLNGIFGLRQDERPIINRIQSIIKNRLQMKDIKDSIKLYENVDGLMKRTRSMLMEDIELLLENKFYKPLKDVFRNLEINKDGSDEMHFSFYIEVPHWHKCIIKLTWDHNGQYYGIIHRDINNIVSKETREVLNKAFPSNCPTNLWPLVQYWKFESVNSLDIWKEVDSGSVFDFFRDWISKVLNATEGHDV